MKKKRQLDACDVVMNDSCLASRALCTNRFEIVTRGKNDKSISKF